MVKVIVTHEVKDFSTWKTAFDEGEGDRTNAGVRLNGVYSAHDNPNPEQNEIGVSHVPVIFFTFPIFGFPFLGGICS